MQMSFGRLQRTTPLILSSESSTRMKTSCGSGVVRWTSCHSKMEESLLVDFGKAWTPHCRRPSWLEPEIGFSNRRRHSAVKLSLCQSSCSPSPRQRVPGNGDTKDDSEWQTGIQIP